MPEEVKNNAAEQAAQAQKQPVPMPTTYEALRHDLIASGRAYDFDMIDRAYQLASAAHATQFRRSGEPYICHPISVAQLLVELGMDSESVAAALMHDVAEDTPVTIDEIRQKFGSEVALLVDGVTKLTQIKFSNVEDRKAENLRKMLLAMSQDVRVMIIKLCDRLHNMRTGDAWPEQKRRDKALETMEVYAPIAHRLGISNIKEELEDRSLQYLDPVGYNMIRSLLNKHGDDFLNDICTTIQEHLEQNGIHGATIRHRVKSIYGIYRKMYMQNKDFEEIYDIYAVRIIIDTVAECYTALGLIHDMYHPLPNRFKDYISTPKPNGYQSLHTTVIGREAIPFEVQIRTREMDRNAEYGIAAHWKYKAGITAASSDRLDERLAWVRQLLESQRSSIDATDLLSDIKSDLLPEEVFADAYALHFCSVSLGDYPMKQAHKKAIEKASAAGVMISFDPNLRPQLWPDQAQLKAAVTEFLPCADILKLSDEELFFVTGKEHIEDAVEELFAMGISVILYTKGSQGAEVYTRTAHVAVSGTGKKAVDTTGAGDGFIGSFLNQLAYEGRTLDDMKKMTDKEWESYLIFSNRYCGESIQKKGALSSYLTRQEMEMLFG